MMLRVNKQWSLWSFGEACEMCKDNKLKFNS